MTCPVKNFLFFKIMIFSECTKLNCFSRTLHEIVTICTENNTFIWAAQIDVTTADVWLVACDTRILICVACHAIPDHSPYRMSAISCQAPHTSNAYHTLLVSTSDNTMWYLSPVKRCHVSPCYLRSYTATWDALSVLHETRDCLCDWISCSQSLLLTWY